MGISGIMLGITLLATASATAYAIYVGMQGNKDQLSPERDFKPTMAKEGSVARLFYGRKRFPGYLLWWGNLLTETIEQKTGGKGIGGSGAAAIAGYRIYVDAWQAVAIGKVSFVKTYINDKEDTINAADIVYNDGTQDTYPASLPKANRLPGVAHVYLDKWYVGDNVSGMPTVHWVLDRVLETPLAHQNMGNGNNPAAVIYDLLIQGSAKHSQINVPTFQAAADRWYQQEIGINLAFDSQVDVSQAIEKVLKYVDGIFYIDSYGKYALRALDPSDVFEAELLEHKIKDFSINRKTWKQVPNYFTATYIDEDMDFSNRALSTPNPAAFRLAGKKIPASIDMKCFRDKTTAAKRLWETMKRQSYPSASTKFKYDLSALKLLPGSVFRISMNAYGIQSADFRIETIDTSGIDKNEIGITAKQMSETLFDDHFLVENDSSWQDPDTDPVALTYSRVFELPYNKRTGFDTAFLILAAREKQLETNFYVYVSNEENQGYELIDDFTSWAQRGELGEEYPENTFKIDDDRGILYTPYKFDPEFDSIDRAQLFSLPRFAIVDDEIMKFQTVTAIVGGQYRLGGVIRDYHDLGEKATHASGSEIWITYFANNVLENINWSDFYVKIVPAFLGKTVSLASVSAIHVSASYKAKKPMTPGRLKATRSGNDITVQIWPRSPGYSGAGVNPPSVTDTAPPFEFGGDFQCEYDSIVGYFTMDSFSITRAGAVAITIKSRLNGFISLGRTVNVGASDGDYYG